MLKWVLFLVALANIIIIALMVHLRKENWLMSLSIIEIIIVYFAVTLPEE